MPLSTVTIIAPLCLGLLEPLLVSESAPLSDCGGDGGFDLEGGGGDSGGGRSGNSGGGGSGEGGGGEGEGDSPEAPSRASRKAGRV